MASKKLREHLTEEEMNRMATEERILRNRMLREAEEAKEYILNSKVGDKNDD